MESIADTQAKIRAFRDARDWMQFHQPKNLAASIVIEAAELLEQFQWTRTDETEAAVQQRRDGIANEMADVAMYLFELADNLKIDLIAAVDHKMRLNETRYPVDKAKGSAKKHDQL